VLFDPLRAAPEFLLDDVHLHVRYLVLLLPFLFDILCILEVLAPVLVILLFIIQTSLSHTL
jgi:hypothetical protein